MSFGLILPRIATTQDVNKALVVLETRLVAWTNREHTKGNGKCEHTLRFMHEECDQKHRPRVTYRLVQGRN